MLLDGKVADVVRKAADCGRLPVLRVALTTEEGAKRPRKGVIKALTTDIEWYDGLHVGKVGDLKKLIAASGDRARLQHALDAEQAKAKPRKGIVASVTARLGEITVAADGASDGDLGGTIEEPGAITDGDTREELGGLGSIEGMDTAGELGGAIEGAGDLGSGTLGTGENEVTGNIEGGALASGLVGDNDDPMSKVVKRGGAGCKQPGDVIGFHPGRLLVSVRSHRGRHGRWGKVEYRVLCLPNGGYQLVGLEGGHRDDGLKVGTEWPFPSEMFFQLMGIPATYIDDDGAEKRNRHRMTLSRFFRLDKQ